MDSIRTERTDSLIGGPSPDPRPAVVVGIGKEWAQAAATYAQACGRPHVVLARREQLWSTLGRIKPRSAYVFLAAQSADHMFFQEIASAGLYDDLACGVLPSEPEEAKSIADRLARLRSHPRIYPSRMAVYCDFLADRPTELPGSFGSAQANEFVEVLLGGVCAVVYHGHGNGADFRVGRNVICVQADSPAPSPGRAGEWFLECQAGGRCRLENKDVRQFVGSNSIRASVVVLLSCGGVGTPNGLLDARFCLARRLMEGKYAEAVVSSYKVNVNDQGLLAGVARYLDGGATVGHLTQAINALRETSSYVCIGDPELALHCEHPTVFVSPSPPLPAGQSTAHSFEARLSGRMPVVGNASVFVEPEGRSRHQRAASRRLQMQLLQKAIARSDFPLEKGKLLLAKLEDQVTCLSGPNDFLEVDAALGVSGVSRALDRCFSLFLSHVLVKRGAQLWQYLLGDYPALAQSATGMIHSCRRTLFVSQMPISKKPEVNRWLWICERCGPVFDTPVRTPVIDIDLLGDTIVPRMRARSIGTGAWVAVGLAPLGDGLVDPGGLVVPTVREFDPAIPMECALRLPTLPHAGLRCAGVVLVWDGDYAVAQLPLMYDPREGVNGWKRI